MVRMTVVISMTVLCSVVTMCHMYQKQVQIKNENKSIRFHFKNMSMQYTGFFFLVVRNLKFHLIFVYSFLIFAQNIVCGYSLEPPRRGGSNVYPQSMF